MTTFVLAEIAQGDPLPTGDHNCPVTLPPDSSSLYGNEYLKAGLPADGKIVFKAGGPGFVDRDGALGIKFAWQRLAPGQVRVGGRRLDDDAPPARAYFSDGYGDSGFQPSYLVFPTPGCWEITGGVGEHRLTFVLLVERLGDPPWKFEGIGAGWRVTDSPGGD